MLERGHYGHLRGSYGALYGYVEVGGLPVDRRHTAALVRSLETSTRTSMAKVARRIGIPRVCAALFLCVFSGIDCLAVVPSGMVGVCSASGPHSDAFVLGGKPFAYVLAARVKYAFRRTMNNGLYQKGLASEKAV